MKNISKEVLRKIKPQGSFNATRLIENSQDMERRMEETIKKCERKIRNGQERLRREDTKIN